MAAYPASELTDSFDKTQALLVPHCATNFDHVHIAAST